MSIDINKARCPPLPVRGEAGIGTASPQFAAHDHLSGFFFVVPEVTLLPCTPEVGVLSCVGDSATLPTPPCRLAASSSLGRRSSIARSNLSAICPFLFSIRQPAEFVHNRKNSVRRVLGAGDRVAGQCVCARSRHGGKDVALPG